MADARELEKLVDSVSGVHTPLSSDGSIKGTRGVVVKTPQESAPGVFVNWESEVTQEWISNPNPPNYGTWGDVKIEIRTLTELDRLEPVQIRLETGWGRRYSRESRPLAHSNLTPSHPLVLAMSLSINPYWQKNPVSGDVFTHAHPEVGKIVDFIIRGDGSSLGQRSSTPPQG